MVVLLPGKVLPFFVILYQVLLKSSQVASASADVSWFPEYDKYKPTHYGKHFILGLPVPENENLLDQISIAALFDTNVTITSALSKNPLYTVYIKAGETVQYNVPNSLRINQRGTERKGVEINATNDIAVIVLLRDASDNSDAFIALPTNVLGMKYVVPTWTRASGLPQIVVISCHDKTVVNIKLRMSQGYFTYNGYSYHNGNTLSVTLDKLGTSYVFDDADFSGTVITANKPIAVISGQLNARVSSNDYDNLASFLLPVKNWGTDFILTAVETLNVGDVFRVFASDSDTIVYNGKTNTVLQSGEYVELDQGSSLASFVNCSKPCQVTQYTKQRSRYNVYSNAGPSMINLPSIDQFLPSYFVVLLAGSRYRHSITLVIKQYVKDGLLMNGKPLTGLSWQTVKNTKYCWTVVHMNNNKYITHSIPGVTFGLLVFGAHNSISYGYPGGFTFRKGLKEAKPCRRKVDLGFVLDSSGSVSTSNYQKMKTFVKDLTNFFIISPDETRVSVMSFSSDATIHIPFSRHFDDNIELSTAIDGIDYSGGGTATAIALNMAYQDMFQEKNGARKTGVSKVLIILTDGQSSGGVEGPAEKLKNAGVIIFSVGIGQNINMDELYSMASQPKEQRVILLENFQELSTLAKKMSSTTCNVSRFAVTCDKDSMSLTYERSSLPDYMINIDELALQDRSCKARYNKTHIIAKTALNRCGTSSRETEQELIFSNSLTTTNVPSDGAIINREKEISLKFSCTYGRLRTVGSFNFLPAKQKLTITEKNVGNFTFAMDFYKDTSYGQAYINDDYPVSKSLSDQIYVQYSVDTGNSDIVIRAKTCRATPTNKPYDQPQYVFIDDGCDKDPTIRHYTSGLQQVHRFSIQAFSFVINHRYVYFHCDLVLCKRGTANSICTQSTSCPTRTRRDARSADDGSKFYQLSTGPLIYRERKDEVNSKENSLSSGSHGILMGSLFGVAVLAVVLISILGVLIMKRRRTAYETSSNVQALSMENIVATKE